MSSNAELTKSCASCGPTVGPKPISAFNRDKRRPDGLLCYCRDCLKIRNAQRYVANREKIQDRNRRWGAENKARVSQVGRAYYAANKAKVLAKRRERQAADPEAVRTYFREYARRNKVRKTDAVIDRRARKRNQFVERVYRKKVHARDSGACYLCGNPVTLQEMNVEHVVPLSRGGLHGYANVRTSCSGCNTRKGTRLLEELLTDGDFDTERLIAAMGTPGRVA